MKRSSKVSRCSLRAAVVAGALASALVLGAETSRGQSGPDMTAVYGRGIHAYFANRTSQADAYFSQVINAGSQDPRVFYFRAMARLRAGRQYEAQQDMQLGAMFEARDPGAAGSVGQALTRIQGRNRQVLEQYRRQARLLHSEDQAALAQARYREQRRQETEVLRQESPVDLGTLADGDAPPAAPPAETATPQPELTEEPAIPAEEPGAVETVDDAVNPFGTPEPVADAPPMIEDPAVPANDMPASDDPFGDAGFGDEPEADAGTPFDDSATEPSAEQPSLPTDDDPFGDVPAADDAGAGADEPFGDAPATGDAAEDPFSMGDPADDATTPAESTEPAGQGGEGGGLLGRVLGRTFSDLMPSLPTTLPGMGESDVPAAMPPAEDFEFGPGDAPVADAPVADGQPATAEEGDAGFGTDDPFSPATDDPFAPSADDPSSGDPTTEESPAASDAPAEEPAAEDAGDPFSDPFGGGDSADPFAPSDDGPAAADDETEAPTEEPAADGDASGESFEDDPFGGN
jgi:hypothetical protein